MTEPKRVEEIAATNSTVEGGMYESDCASGAVRSTESLGSRDRWRRSPTARSIDGLHCAPRSLLNSWGDTASMPSANEDAGGANG